MVSDKQTLSVALIKSRVPLLETRPVFKTALDGTVYGAEYSGDLLGVQAPFVGEFEAQATLLAARFGLSSPVARQVLSLLRGGASE